MKIVSWNVNGLRAVYKNGYWDEFLKKLPADIYCIQETKARPEQLDEKLKNPKNYKSFFNFPEHKKGYAGVALYIHEKLKPSDDKIIYSVWDNFYDEGRIIGYKIKEDLYLFNVYFPNGGMSEEALQYKLDFYYKFLDYLVELRANNISVIVAGDFNVAHEEIDLARPKENEGSVGFLPEERAWFSELLDAGFIDVWRYFNPESVKYSWWSMRTRARERNVGWRIDYFVISEDLLSFVNSVQIHNEIYGSDHCPISLDININ